MMNLIGNALTVGMWRTEMDRCDNCGEKTVVSGTVTRSDTGDTVQAIICTNPDCEVIETTEYWSE